MSNEPDPEVVADLKLRAATERDRSRTRGEGVYEFQPSPVVAEWACRNDRCRNLVAVPQEALDRVAVFDGILARQDQQPLDVGLIVYCNSCRIIFLRTAADRRRWQVERMRPAIAQLKSSGKPEEERGLMKQLDAWGHPDVLGLVQAIRSRLDGGGASKKIGRSSL